MTVVDFLAYESHFLEHLVPMYQKLPEEYKGKFLVRKGLGNLARNYGVPAIEYGKNRAHSVPLMRERNNMMVAAASGDLALAHKAGLKAVFTQHGGGQSFNKLHPSYAGWRNHKNVQAFIHPGNHPAARDRAAYQGRIPAHVCGCPKMDPWHDGTLQQPEEDGLPVVVFSSHWHCSFVPETGSTFWHMLPGLKELAKLNGEKFILKGHGHPRSFRKFAETYRQLGIEPIRSFSNVMKQGHLYVMDSMSTLYEFASAGKDGNGRPVVVMNSPRFRKNVNHGLRFWDASEVGINVWQPAQLVDAVLEALEDSADQQKKRREAVDMVYGFTDGKAAERAAAGIVKAANEFKKPVRQKTATVHTTIRKPNRKPIMDYFSRTQKAAIAINRLRNARRGHRIVKGGKAVEQGMNARPGQFFFSDEQHIKELVANGSARWPEEFEEVPTFPGVGEQDQPIVTITEAQMPKIEALATGGGYYDIVSDGVTVQQVKTKALASKTVKKLEKEWKEANLPKGEQQPVNEAKPEKAEL